MSTRIHRPASIITPAQFHDDELARLAAIARKHDARMLYQNWYEELLGCTVADGPALTASTVATSLLPATAASPKIVIPADYLLRIGQRMRVVATGRVSNIVTTPGTLTLDVRFGSVVVANGGAMALNTVAKTNVSWELWWEFTLRSIGTGAQWFHTGSWVSESVVGSAAGAANCCSLPSSAPALGTAFDSSASNAIDLFGTWSLSNANSIQCHQFAAYLSN